MNKKRIIFFSIVAVLALGAFYFYYNFLYQDARNIQNEKPAFTITTSNLSDDYLKNTLNADTKYLNQTIQVAGKVTEVSDSSVVLDNKVFCKMDMKVDANSMHKELIIKGRCIGYDDLFELVKLDQCNKL